MKKFDCFIGIDWSGAKTPLYTKSIAVAVCEQGRTAPYLIPGPWSRTKVYEYILGLLAEKRRVLIGIDANFGYAREILREQFPKSCNYKTLWAEVEKRSQAEENFFAGGYWEAFPQYFWSEGKKPAHIRLPKRTTEIICGEAGYGWPESPFKLLGPKQVGKGGLAAMRMALALKEAAGDKICIWPFEKTRADTSQIVLTEIYPRQFLRRVGHGSKKITTLTELNAALKILGSNIIKNDTYRFNNHDTDAIVSAAGLRRLCGGQKTIPKVIENPPAMNEKSIQCEGWIFGVGDQT